MTGPTDSSTVHRRQPLLRTETTISTKKMMNHCETLHKRKGEVAGRTAAECATVCCCVPCTVVHFLILAVYKVPAGLCRKMLWKNKQKRLLNKKNENKCCQISAAGDGKESENVNVNVVVIGGPVGGGDGNPASAESEMEMWGRYYEGGFWRNSSQKKED